MLSTCANDLGTRIVLLKLAVLCSVHGGVDPRPPRTPWVDRLAAAEAHITNLEQQLASMMDGNLFASGSMLADKVINGLHKGGNAVKGDLALSIVNLLEKAHLDFATVVSSIIMVVAVRMLLLTKSSPVRVGRLLRLMLAAITGHPLRLGHGFLLEAAA